ncbi:hypothetical protein [Microbacterium esteraromaticum]|uniref:hypothetical protein n=1 Tax=Microbacterium esteraromaticum TaxID=57043 RepID=UPI001956FF39|nr:hypothetical protein [Microbacterium esteraromaticum]MBM7466111.1 hypothetical protein [Microbacterium esteraromaticum]
MKPGAAPLVEAGPCSRATADVNDEQLIVLIQVRFEAVAKLFRGEAAAHDPCRIEVVPPGSELVGSEEEFEAQLEAKRERLSRSRVGERALGTPLPAAPAPSRERVDEIRETVYSAVRGNFRTSNSMFASLNWVHSLKQQLEDGETNSMFASLNWMNPLKQQLEDGEKV